MKHFKNILFFADGQDDLNQALKKAAKLAESNNARLTLVDAIETVETPDEVMTKFGFELNDLLKKHRNEALLKLSKLIENLENPIDTKVLIGLPFLEVIKFVQRGGYDLLIKMAHPPAGITDKIFGSLDLHLLRKCPCPVLIDRPSSTASFKRILAAVDADSSLKDGCDKLIMQLATSLSERENAQLDIIHAWQLAGESMLSSGRSRLSAAELQILLKSEENKTIKKLEGLLHPYDINTDDKNVHVVKGLAAVNQSINHIAKQKNLTSLSCERLVGSVSQVF